MKPDGTADCEVYRNFFVVNLKRFSDGKRLQFRMRRGEKLDGQGLYRALKSLRFFTFNGIKYDMPIIGYALAGATTDQLKQLSDELIQSRLMPWDAEKRYGFTIPTDLDHVDLIDVVPGVAVSLKTYGGKMHSRMLQDLPYEHDIELDMLQIELLVIYGCNDNDLTEDLAKKFKEQIDIRTRMSSEYGQDLRSKSDAQIAESVLKAKIGERLGWRVGKPDVPVVSFRYEPPPWMRFSTAALQQAFAEICAETFFVKPNGKVQSPKALEGRKITLGSSTYKLGIGGFHSTEKAAAHRVDGVDWILSDHDVASYYPAIIIQTMLYPKHLGKTFLNVYRDIRDTRIKLKTAGKKIESDTFKIVLNGAFGKFGSGFSTLYSPDLLMQVTVTGQLALMMLIEALEIGGIAVVSANTDGIVLKLHKSQIEYRDECLKWWEKVTGFDTEETRYMGLYSASVNAYIALKQKQDKATKQWRPEIDGVKLKGDFAEPEPVASSWPSPTHQVVTHAVCHYLQYGTPLEFYIRTCSDIKQFVMVQKVDGGATWKGQFVGKTCRWIYTKNDGAPLLRKRPHPKTGNHGKVAKSDGCRPMMNLSEHFPLDIDYDHYISIAYNTLRTIGALNDGVAVEDEVETES